MDILLFGMMTIVPTFIMTLKPKVLWIILPLLLLFLIKKPISSVSGGDLTFFKGIKILSSCLALVCVNLLQLRYEIFSYEFILVLLSINIFEAVLTDCNNLIGIPNGISGFILILLIPRGLEINIIQECFLFPLEMPWILLYTSWNAAFVYGVGLSRSFNLILIVPLIVSYLLKTPHSWLGARSYSLVLNQFYRGLEFPWIYKPGLSYLTKKENTVSTNRNLRLIWGSLNLFATFILYCSSAP